MVGLLAWVLVFIVDRKWKLVVIVGRQDRICVHNSSALVTLEPHLSPTRRYWVLEVGLGSKIIPCASQAAIMVSLLRSKDPVMQKWMPENGVFIVWLSGDMFTQSSTRFWSIWMLVASWKNA